MPQEQGLRRGHLNLVVAAPSAAFPTRHRLGQRVYGLHLPDQVPSQEMRRARHFQGLGRRHAPRGGLPDIAPGQRRQAFIHPARAPPAAAGAPGPWGLLRICFPLFLAHPTASPLETQLPPRPGSSCHSHWHTGYQFSAPFFKAKMPSPPTPSRSKRRRQESPCSSGRDSSIIL